MKWYKHSTDSHDDPDISDAMDEFGACGYSAFFILLEIYGREFNSLDADGFLNLSKRFIARKLRQSSTKVEKLLNFYSKRKRIFSKLDGNRVLFCIPQFIEISSNWTKRQKVLPTEALQRDAVAPTAIKKKKKKKNIKDIVEYPGWLDILLWKEFKKYRTKIKAPLTDHAEKLCLTDLKKVIDEGHIQADVINQTIMSGKWKSFYPVRDKTDSQDLKPKTYAQAQDAERRMMARSVLEDMKDAEKNNITSLLPGVTK